MFVVLLPSSILKIRDWLLPLMVRFVVPGPSMVSESVIARLAGCQVGVAIKAGSKMDRAAGVGVGVKDCLPQAAGRSPAFATGPSWRLLTVKTLNRRRSSKGSKCSRVWKPRGIPEGGAAGQTT